MCMYRYVCTYTIQHTYIVVFMCVSDGNSAEVPEARPVPTLQEPESQSTLSRRDAKDLSYRRLPVFKGDPNGPSSIIEDICRKLGARLRMVHGSATYHTRGYFGPVGSIET